MLMEAKKDKSQIRIGVWFTPPHKLERTNTIPGQPALDACTRAFLVSLLPWISPELFDSPPAHAPSIMCQ